MSRNPFLLVYSEQDGLDRDTLKKYLNSRSEVLSWCYSMPNSIFIISTIESPGEFAKLLLKRFGKFRHFIIRVDDYEGILPSAHWDIIKKV